MKMTCNIPDHAKAVEALLEGFVRCCMVCIDAGLAPLDPMDTGVRYQLEPQGEEDWKLPQNVIRDGWGDCEDVAAWRAAGLRLSGEDDGARCVVMSTGPRKLHAVVLRSDGRIDDPSRDLYMRQRRASSMGGVKLSHDAQGRRVLTKDHRGAGKKADWASAQPAAARAADAPDAVTQRDAFAERRFDAATNKAEGQVDTRNLTDYGRSQERSVYTSPEEAAAAGLKWTPEGASRMTAEERANYEDYGYDPTGKYADMDDGGGGGGGGWGDGGGDDDDEDDEFDDGGEA